MSLEADKPLLAIIQCRHVWYVLQEPNKFTRVSYDAQTIRKTLRPAHDIWCQLLAPAGSSNRSRPISQSRYVHCQVPCSKFPVYLPCSASRRGCKTVQ